MEEFKSLDELYERLKPAFRSKCAEFKRIGIDYIQEVDIWNYLKLFVWKQKKDLTLAEMVNDIMVVNYIDIDTYLKEILSKMKRKLVKNQKKDVV